LALQIGHRKSVDIDLFTLSEIPVNQTIEFLESKFDFRLDYSAINTIKGSIQDIKVDLIAQCK
jgi:hypothetical protein